jgi:oxygen-independent coproporphyrinogen-3 oxidase
LHWPFCRAKSLLRFQFACPHGGIDRHLPARYLASAHSLRSRWAERFGIFFGGGTPSLMAPSTVAAILDAIAAHWRLENDAEITLEANPTSVEAENFAGYAAAGVNRLSLGVQALDDASLKALGRQHTAAEALAALALAKRNFSRVSFDLIYAREGQAARAWREELSRALDHAADHLSLYQLTIEESTPFTRATPRAPAGAEWRCGLCALRADAGALRGHGAPCLRGV